MAIDWDEFEECVFSSEETGDIAYYVYNPVFGMQDSRKC